MEENNQNYFISSILLKFNKICLLVWRYESTVARRIIHEERRVEIAEAAVEAIAAQGLEDVKMTDIAARAGCTTGMVTYYFKDKDELLRAVLQRVYSTAGERMLRHAYRYPGDLRGVLAESMPLNARSRKEVMVWLPFWSRAASSRALAIDMIERYRFAHGGYVKVLEAAIERGLARRDVDVEREVDTATLLIDGICVRAMHDRRNWPAKRQLAMLDAHLARIYLIPPNRVRDAVASR